ncbi:hypothetical protein G7Y89_g12802 [Cudoniella acicularis]|uniref:Uncharacterized protein n=1 Tax=Cudoniella acicularis TaxID=354080 RepID=A0A8H4R9Q4_9HELO|nr:hypothetical protein G7Y89_g12802 [Cudoniella acicularis]
MGNPGPPKAKQNCDHFGVEEDNSQEPLQVGHTEESERYSRDSLNHKLPAGFELSHCLHNDQHSAENSKGDDDSDARKEPKTPWRIIGTVNQQDPTHSQIPTGLFLRAGGQEQPKSRHSLLPTRSDRPFPFTSSFNPSEDKKLDPRLLQKIFSPKRTHVARKESRHATVQHLRRRP